MSVDVGLGNTIEVFQPKKLIAQAVRTSNESSTNYVVTGDGERFLTMQRGDPGAAELVQGWTNLLEE